MRREENEDAKDKGEVIYYSATQNGTLSKDIGSIGNGIVNNYVPSNNSKPFPKSNIKTPLLFQFTRHATSCFNIKIDKPSLLSISDGIPSLANIGITNTIILAYKNKDTPRFKSPIVCVSNLIRTWMTAVLLYTFSNKKTITLRICPHLRESGLEGNGAYALTSSIPKFIRFLELIKNNTSYSGLREIILLIPNINNPKVWLELTIYIPEDKTKKIQNDPLFCMITDPLLGKGYTDVGDITEFMKWYLQSFPEEKGTVHIVAHSGIMKKYVEKICKGYILPNKTEFNMKTYSVSKNRIDEENCWSFTTTYKGVNVESLLQSIQPGYLNPGKGNSLKGAQTAERGQGSKSLCLETVEPIVCPKKGGKRRTKKNHKSRTRRRLRRTMRRS